MLVLGTPFEVHITLGPAMPYTDCPCPAVSRTTHNGFSQTRTFVSQKSPTAPFQVRRPKHGNAVVQKSAAPQLSRTPDPPPPLAVPKYCCCTLEPHSAHTTASWVLLPLPFRGKVLLCIAQAGLGLTILLPQAPEYWDYKCTTLTWQKPFYRYRLLSEGLGI